jgi:transposase
MRTRTRSTAEFKVKVALEAIPGQRTLGNWRSGTDCHPTQIAAWKRETGGKLAQVFDDKRFDLQPSLFALAHRIRTYSRMRAGISDAVPGNPCLPVSHSRFRLVGN